MSQINFEKMDADNRELKPVFKRLDAWRRDHADWRILDPRVISRDLNDVDPLLLTFALYTLARKGVYRIVYMVTTPSGVLADGEYDDPKSIPERVPDRFNRYFDTADTDVVPVFKPVAR